MARATVNRKGQTTVPAAVRRKLGLSPGDSIRFVQVAAGRFELVAVTQPSTAAAVRGARLGVAKGMFEVPDDIDTPYSEEIERIFNGG